MTGVLHTNNNNFFLCVRLCTKPPHFDIWSKNTGHDTTHNTIHHHTAQYQPSKPFETAEISHKFLHSTIYVKDEIVLQKHVSNIQILCKKNYRALLSYTREMHGLAIASTCKIRVRTFENQMFSPHAVLF